MKWFGFQVKRQTPFAVQNGNVCGAASPSLDTKKLSEGVFEALLPHHYYQIGVHSH